MESLERYARPCRLAEVAASRKSVRLLDVGTGLGLNLAAALAECGAVPLDVVTLELDAQVLRAALELPLGPESAAPHQRVCRTSLGLALATPGQVVPFGSGSLRLLLGDALQTLAGQPRGELFDAVFLDPFSPARGRALWERGFLADVAARMTAEALLSTYTASLTVRVELVHAGLDVGRGPRVGTKGSGTLARRMGGLRTMPPLEPRTQRRLAARVARTA